MNRCADCRVHGSETPLWVTGYEPKRLQCAECMRAVLFRYRLALHNIASHQAKHVCDPGCSHDIAADALRDR